MDKKLNTNSEKYQFTDETQQYTIRLSYRKYFWRIVFYILIIAKLVGFYLTKHAPYYRIFQILQMDDIKKSWPMFIKNILIKKVESQYLIDYPLIGLIAFFSLSIIWYILVCRTTSATVNFKYIEVKSGVLNTTTDSIDLVDVRDQYVKTPWYHRLLHVSNLIIESRDVSLPHFVMSGVGSAEADHFMKYLRENNFHNMTDLRRAKDVQNNRNNKPTKETIVDDGEGYGDEH